MTKLIDTPKCLLVKVPEGIIGYLVIRDNNLYYAYKSSSGEVFDKMVILPAGSYHLPILAIVISEERAESLVEYWTDGAEGQITHWTEWKNYEKADEWDEFGMLFALDSFASLLRSHNLQPSTTVVIPKTI